MAIYQFWNIYYISYFVTLYHISWRSATKYEMQKPDYCSENSNHLIYIIQMLDNGMLEQGTNTVVSWKKMCRMTKNTCNSAQRLKYR